MNMGNPFGPTIISIDFRITTTNNNVIISNGVVKDTTANKEWDFGTNFVSCTKPPTQSPLKWSTEQPTNPPTLYPSQTPTSNPLKYPTKIRSISPVDNPTLNPSLNPISTTNSPSNGNIIITNQAYT
eukprot:254101_1